MSTVSRRIAALEEQLGVALFVRTPDGLSPTAAADAVLGEAEEVEARALAIEERIDALAGVPRGLVRVSLAGADMLSFIFLPQLAALLERWPELSVEFESSAELSDISRREADIAVRIVRPTAGGDEVIAKKVRDEGFSAWASTQYLDRVGRGRSPSEYAWIGPEASRDDLIANQSLAQLSGGAYRLRLSDQTATRQAVRMGLGCAVLSDTFAELTPGLERVAGLPSPAFTAPLFLVCARALRHVPRVAAVWDFLVEELHNREGELELLSGRLQQFAAD